jgi:alkylation response protein AidB-like acyl-CoA dehydrogenase
MSGLDLYERKQFGQSISEFRLMQGKLADMYSTLQPAALGMGSSTADGTYVPSMCDETSSSRTRAPTYLAGNSSRRRRAMW